LSALEVPVLRLGLAGFSPEQEQAIQAAAAASRLTQWQCVPLPGADAWFINGQCAQHLGEGRLRVASRQPGGRSTQLHLFEAQRPVAFAAPLPAALEAMVTFDLAKPEAIVEAIGMFEFVLAAQAAQFLLAAQVVEHQEILGSGAFELRAKGQVIAAVDMRGDAGVLASARPSNFDVAVWNRVEREHFQIPSSFTRSSLAELMWRYVSRSSRDLLPARYRHGPVFFRRAPRLDPMLVEESHLLVMRELAIQPCTFDELTERLAMPEPVLVQALSALYYVGSVTANSARAAPTTIAGELPRRSRRTSNYGELRTSSVPLELTDLRLLTAPAPLALA
jgi:DNA-binding transcriptional ArsR family regulator